MELEEFKCVNLISELDHRSEHALALKSAKISTQKMLVKVDHDQVKGHPE